MPHSINQIPVYARISLNCLFQWCLLHVLILHSFNYSELYAYYLAKKTLITNFFISKISSCLSFTLYFFAVSSFLCVWFQNVHHWATFRSIVRQFQCLCQLTIDVYRLLFPGLLHFVFFRGHLILIAPCMFWVSY